MLAFRCAGLYKSKCRVLTGNYFGANPLSWVFVVGLNIQLECWQLLLLPLLWLIYFWRLWGNKHTHTAVFHIQYILLLVFCIKLSCCDPSINTHYLQQEGSSSFSVCGQCGRASSVWRASEGAGQGAEGWEPSKTVRRPGPEATPEGLIGLKSGRGDRWNTLITSWNLWHLLEGY